MKENKKRQQSPWRLRSMYKWIRGIVVIEQRVDKYKYIKKKREIWILREKTVRGKEEKKRGKIKKGEES